MAVLFVSGMEADRAFVMRLARELADVVDAVQVGEHPLTTPPPPTKKPDESYSAVVAILSPTYLPKLAALKAYCDQLGLALIPVSRYPPTDPLPELGRHAIYFRDAYYTEAFLKLLEELREAKVRVYIQGRRSQDHYSPLEDVRVPDFSPRVMFGLLLRGMVIVGLLVGGQAGYDYARDQNAKQSPTTTPYIPPTLTPTPPPTQIPDAAFELSPSHVNTRFG